MITLYMRMSSCMYPWLWWQAFGAFSPPRAMQPLARRVSRVRVMQERSNRAQRRARKRRAFLHRLNRQC